LSIEYNSPCINTGTNTLAVYDFDGNTTPLNVF